MKYPLNWATFVDLGWPLRVTKHEKGSICDFYGLKNYWVVTSAEKSVPDTSDLIPLHVSMEICVLFINTAQI